MDSITAGQLTEENIRLLRWRNEFLDQVHVKPEIFWPFLRPCDVRILMVVDGLDFSDANFGLSTFVRTLLDTPGNHVRFRITLAHIGNANATQMLDGEPRIVRRITGFRFDNADHFAADMYDAVMLFGIESSLAGRNPVDRLADSELRVLTEFMNAGGGLFATGDHGSLGRFLCHAVPRARNMRLWQSTSAQNALDEVSMTGARRNDTNRLGSSPGSQFDDQSDDVPQVVQPRIYQRTAGFFRYSFPHPLLCGPNGIIRIMPDHPHEGECVEPGNTNLQLDFGGPLGPEYPNATTGGTKPLPEVISTSTVLAGTTSSGKSPTASHSFGGICAYDGHRAGVGRVVTDATWHHFVNINLVGRPSIDPMDPKNVGFLYSAAGQAHLEEIRAYYRNIAVWLAPPPRIRCMNTRLSWQLVWSDRVMEAVLSTTDLRLVDVEPHIFSIIGKHARDVLGRFAGQCQSVKLILDLVLQPAWPEIVPHIDPWILDPPQRRPAPDEIAWFDAMPLLDISLGAALVALREAVPQPDEKTVAALETEKLEAIMAEGGRVGVERAVKSVTSATNGLRSQLKR
jgi:hypothetical protein